MPLLARLLAVLIFLVPGSTVALAQSLTGSVRDETGGALPGVSVELRSDGLATAVSVTDAEGIYRFDSLDPRRYQLAFHLSSFATARREITVGAAEEARVDAVLNLSLSADVTVTGKKTFVNLADAENPAENLVGLRGRPVRAPSRRANSMRARSSAPVRSSKPFPVSSSVSTAARGKPISTTFGASTSITGPTSRRLSPACRSTCPRTRTATATPTSIS